MNAIQSRRNRRKGRNGSTLSSSRAHREIRRLIVGNQFCWLHGIRKIWRCSSGGARTGIKAERYSRVKVTLVLTNTGYDSSLARSLGVADLRRLARSLFLLSFLPLFLFALAASQREPVVYSLRVYRVPPRTQITVN